MQEINFLETKERVLNTKNTVLKTDTSQFLKPPQKSPATVHTGRGLFHFHQDDFIPDLLY